VRANASGMLKKTGRQVWRKCCGAFRAVQVGCGVKVGEQVGAQAAWRVTGCRP